MTTSGAAKPSAAELAGSPLVLEDLLDNGQGVGRVGGLVAFVTGGLPGETVTIAVDAIKRNYISAHVASILERSTDRVDSRCPVFGRCGGCQALHLNYEAQLRWKQRLVRDALERIGGLANVRVEEVVADERGAREGYRNKATLVVEPGQAPRLGFYAARTHRVVPIDACPVLLPRLDAAVRGLIAFAGEQPLLFADVHHVVARASATARDLMLSFNTERPNRALGRAVHDLRHRVSGLTGLAASWQRESANAVFGKRSATLFGSPLTTETVAGTRLCFGIASFFQINTAMLERVCARLLETCARARRVVDLYCGVGTFAVMFGARGASVTGVEGYAPAVDEAVANAARNGVTTAAFEFADVAVAVSGERGRTLLAGADAVIVDPPRKGCETSVLAALAAARVPRIEYVSCNPSTLARDAQVLVASGYAIERVTPFDMFPHAGHVEILAEFVRAP